MPQDITPRPAGGRSVLVVEDEPLIAMELEMMLDQRGYRVLGPVGVLESALRLLQDARPDVAILDLNLHGQLATPIVERLRALDTPFIIASADASVTHGETIFADHAEWIAKPIDENLLMAALDRATP
ncbi:response regulator [Paracoccus liaowanqingii]|uniref:Response regulator n=1 Tax=Paracoccus liaowanqingii TaxID=2560053 RepID=A0A4V1BII7_9RHOB|nr:response regulator [Paracoccus liaowanqingii]QBX33394.1 response regulator [Paracoccus liaowanqingii]